MLHRLVSMGKNGAVAAGHPLAVATAFKVLSQGGNAIDGAIAAAAVSAVVLPHACSLGGDAFMIIHNARNGETKAINASGPAPLAARRQSYLKEGIPQIGLTASTVPGVLQGWADSLKIYGTMELAHLLKDAIYYAQEGFCVSSRLSQTISQCAIKYDQFPSWKKVFTSSGASPRPGQVLVQDDLARTLRAIAKDGPEALYGGEIGQRLVEFCRQNGSAIELEDLKRYRCRIEEPLKTTYRGFSVLETPPNSWGFLLLLQLNLLEGFDLAARGHNRADYIHTMLEAKRVAFAEKDRFLADPDFFDIPMKGLLSKNYAMKLRTYMDPDRMGTTLASLNPAPFGNSDTTYLATADGKGNLVSLIQSVFMPFGCGQVAQDTGIVMNNRMCGFILKEGHPNCLAGGRRPAHTLSPTMVLKDGRAFMALGTPGGLGQTQSLAQIICNIVDFGMGLQEALEAPRWLHEGEEVSLENRIPEEVFAVLATRGYQLKKAGDWNPVHGSAKAIIIDLDGGCLLAGADPRREGMALAW